jgi:hypothetical protein
MVSLLQTSLEDETRKAGAAAPRKAHGLLSHIVGAVESIADIEKYGAHDPDWVTRIGEATLDRLARGNHPFNSEPAEYEIPVDDARVVLVGDWGSGLPRARSVGRFMAQEVANAINHGRSVHVIHLGDVYYSGDPVEYIRRVLAPGLWPVTIEQSRGGVTSWSLNGNHDMYGGGWGYFDTLLADERFANQRSPTGKPTSFFRIKTPSWDIVGLDTAWDSDVLSMGQHAMLADPQAAVVSGWAAESYRKLMLLSHHQLVTSYDHGDIATVLPMKLQPLLGSKRIGAWLWGHEHRCMGFDDPEQRIPFMCCIGHGGIPIRATAKGESIPPPGLWQIPSPGSDSGVFVENDTRWNNFGFAVVDFDGLHARIRYRDDQGTELRAETIP